MENQNKMTDLINLLKTARGQIDAIIEMVRDGKYCADILVQLSAVQGIIKKSTITILENHIEKCISAPTYVIFSPLTTTLAFSIVFKLSL
jgi:DNA-binding FrmR family transcriptional regulator